MSPLLYAGLLLASAVRPLLMQAVSYPLQSFSKTTLTLVPSFLHVPEQGPTTAELN
jgi:hypothetical protein